MSDIRFQPRVLLDVSHIDMSTSVLGYNVSMPIMIAPTGLHKMAHPEGFSLLPFHFNFLLASFEAKFLYGGLSEMQESLLLPELQLLQELLWFERSYQIWCIFYLYPTCQLPDCSYFQTLSTWSSYSIEEVNSTGPGIRFFQLTVLQIHTLY